MNVQSVVKAKIGELIQGVLPDNTSFLVSNISSTYFKNMTTIEVNKNHAHCLLNTKSIQAKKLFWNKLPKEERRIDINKITITQQSNIPIGKGLSSSSADVLGVLKSLNLFYKTSWSDEKKYQLAAQIEPTDPCLHESNILFKQREGKIIQVLPELPFRLIYFDSEIGTIIDTLQFIKRVNYTPQQQKQFEYICCNLEKVFTAADYELFYYFLHLSAEINNNILPKNKFELLQEFAKQHCAGIFVAHSGTYMGFVLSPEKYDLLKTQIFQFVKKNWTQLFILNNLCIS